MGFNSFVHAVILVSDHRKDCDMGGVTGDERSEPQVGQAFSGCGPGSASTPRREGSGVYRSGFGGVRHVCRSLTGAVMHRRRCEHGRISVRHTLHPTTTWRRKVPGARRRARHKRPRREPAACCVGCETQAPPGRLRSASWPFMLSGDVTGLEYSIGTGLAVGVSPASAQVRPWDIATMGESCRCCHRHARRRCTWIPPESGLMTEAACGSSTRCAPARCCLASVRSTLRRREPSRLDVDHRSMRRERTPDSAAVQYLAMVRQPSGGGAHAR